jgi:hypothetical protein
MSVTKPSRSREVRLRGERCFSSFHSWVLAIGYQSVCDPWTSSWRSVLAMQMGSEKNEQGASTFWEDNCYSLDLGSLLDIFYTIHMP